MNHAEELYQKKKNYTKISAELQKKIISIREINLASGLAYYNIPTKDNGTRREKQTIICLETKIKENV